jgi:hypothetical protein
MAALQNPARRLGRFFALKFRNGAGQTRVRSAFYPFYPERVEEVIWWLPADTQTLIVAQGPWQPNFEEDGHGGASACDLGHDESLQLFVSGFERKRRGGESHVPPVAFALEGSRHFRSPKHLGEMPYEGAHLVVFQHPLGPAADTVKRWMTGGFDQSIIDAMPKIKTEKIGGYDVLWYEHKVEDDIWATYFAMPRPDVLIWATDRRYLSELLDRMTKRGSTRALPDNLPEWKHMDIGMPIWGIRHYDRKDAASDPSSPLFPSQREIDERKDRDNQALGLVFTFDAGKSDVASIKYLSANENAFEIARSGLKDCEELKEAIVRTSAPGVVEISISLKGPTGRDSPAGIFLLLVLNAFGHGVFL